jgi:hypothetical protein
MKNNKVGMFKLVALCGIVMMAVATVLHAQTAPFAATNWPPTVSSKAMVHYFIADPKATFATSASWNQSLSFADDGDQTFQAVSHNDLAGSQSTSDFMNIADTSYTAWTNTPVIDVLLEVYGDGTLYTNGSGKEVTFRTGALGSENPVSGGTVPAGVNNGQWNWILFSVTNDINPATGKRYVGNVPDASQANTDNGGVNGGTIRIEGVPGITIRAVAIGPEGAFGTAKEINVFAPAPATPAADTGKK